MLLSVFSVIAIILLRTKELGVLLKFGSTCCVPVSDSCIFLTVLWVYFWSATFPGHARVFLIVPRPFFKDTIFVVLDILDVDAVRQYEFNTVRTQKSI